MWWARIWSVVRSAAAWVVGLLAALLALIVYGSVERQRGREEAAEKERLKQRIKEIRDDAERKDGASLFDRARRWRRGK